MLDLLHIHAAWECCDRSSDGCGNDDAAASGYHGGRVMVVVLMMMEPVY